MPGVVELTDATFTEGVSGDGVTVVKFWAPWCGPCRTFAPIFEEAAAAHPAATFAALDVSAHPGVAASTGVRSIPTVMTFRDGVLVDEHVGALPRAAIDALVSTAAALDPDELDGQLDSGFPDGAVL